MTVSIHVGDDQSASDENITKYIRDSYKRSAKMMLGDEKATMRLVKPEVYLRDRFERWLGWWLRESLMDEETAFIGQIQKLRLFMHGRVYLSSLDNVRNQIIVAYKNTSGGSTKHYEINDTTSQAAYEVRSLILEIEAPMLDATAQDIADDTLAAMKDPEPRLVGFYNPVDGNRLDVEVAGAGQLLKTQAYEETGTGSVDISDDISNVLTESDTIAEGNITANTREIEQEAEWSYLWDRFGDLLKASGPTWLAGCYGSVSFDYYQLDASDVAYYIDFSRGRQFFDYNNGTRIPDALVRPGQYAQVNQLGLGLPSVVLIDSVEWSFTDGLQFGLTTADRLAQIEFEIEQIEYLQSRVDGSLDGPFRRKKEPPPQLPRTAPGRRPPSGKPRLGR